MVRHSREIVFIEDVNIEHPELLVKDMSVWLRELEILCELSKGHKRIVEIGTGNGYTIHEIYRHAKPISCITIDNSTQPHIGQYCGDGPIKVKADSTKIFYDHIETLMGGKPDFIFIDGCHDKEEVRIDTEMAMKNCDPQGTIVWHDYCRRYPEVMDVVNMALWERSDGRAYTVEGTRLMVYTRRVG